MANNEKALALATTLEKHSDLPIRSAAAMLRELVERVDAASALIDAMDRLRTTRIPWHSQDGCWACEQRRLLEDEVTTARVRRAALDEDDG